MAYLRFTVRDILTPVSLVAVAVGLLWAAIAYSAPWLILLAYGSIGASAGTLVMRMRGRRLAAGLVYGSLFGVLLGYLLQIVVLAVVVLSTHR
jgi:hypothetical protein